MPIDPKPPRFSAPTHQRHTAAQPATQPVKTAPVAAQPVKTPGLADSFAAPASSPANEVMATMMEYMRLASKEQRETTPMNRLDSSRAKLEQQNKSIDAGMDEAREKADIAMQQATNSLVMGIVGGAVQIGAAVQSFTAGQGVAIDAATANVKAPNTLQSPPTLSAAGPGDEGKKTQDHKQSVKDAIKKELDLLANVKPKI